MLYEKIIHCVIFHAAISLLNKKNVKLNIYAITESLNISHDAKRIELI